MQIVLNLLGWKSQKANTQVFNSLLPEAIGKFTIPMGTTIDFKRQFLVSTVEIDYKSANRNLTPKLTSVDLTASDRIPKKRLALG